MRVMLVDPAADWSTRDVYNGLRDGLRSNRVRVIEFRLGRYLTVFGHALDKAWEEGQRQDSQPTMHDKSYLASSQAALWYLRHQPDWVIIVSGMYVHPDAMVLLRRAGARVGLLLTETPYDYEQELRVAHHADVVWTNERTAVEVFKQVNPHSYYLPHAYHPMHHSLMGRKPPDVDAIPSHDVVFVGTLFDERIKLLEAVDWTGIDLGLYGYCDPIKDGSPLKRFVRGGIMENWKTAWLYRKAKIGLNLFRSSMGFDGRRHIFGAESLGPRAYELAATGTFFVSQYRAEVPERFGDLVPTFSTADELSSVLTTYLADPPSRVAKASALPAAVRGHSWVERAADVAAHLASRDATPESEARDAPAAAL